MSDRQLLDAIDEVTDCDWRRPPTPASRSIPAALQARAESLLTDAGWMTSQDGRFILSREHGCTIGLDLGGTKLRGALADCGGRVVAELEQPTTNTAPDSAIIQMTEMVHVLARNAGISADSVEAVAVGIPGVVANDGRVALSPNVAFDRGTPLAATLSAEIGAQVDVENDSNLAAFGEYAAGWGRAENVQSLAFLAIGTGVGMGLIIEGHLLHGHSGAAGEIGFLPFGADPYAGALQHPGGSFEAAVGSDAIRRAFRELAGEDIGVREIFDRGDGGDARAAAVVQTTLRNVALGVSAAVALIDPGVVVVGGGIGSRPGVAEAIAELTARLVPTACRVVTSALGDRAGVTGALAYARERAKLRLIEGHDPRGLAA